MATPNTLPVCIKEVRRLQAKISELMQVQYKQMPAWLVTDVVNTSLEVLRLSEQLLSHYEGDTTELQDRIDELRIELGMGPK